MMAIKLATMMTSRTRSALGSVVGTRVISALRLTQGNVQLRCFSKVTTPSTRRRRSTDPVVKAEIKEEQEADDEKWNIDFDAEVMKLMTQVNDAVVPMIPLNPGFAVVFCRDTPSLIIQTAKGKLSFTSDKEQGLVNLQSFLSGAQHYYFDVEERSWLSKRDHHNLRGLVTRDLIRHNRGCPDLDEKP